MDNIRVFLDTNVLLKAFAAFRRGQPLPAFLSDPQAVRYTFEKCVFEAYLAFRGVGGKKPDEGRGNWAQSHLDKNTESRPVSDLASKYHDGDSKLAFFWVNHIDSVRWGGLDDYDTLIDRLLLPSELDDAKADLDDLHQLAAQRHLFDVLCEQFAQMIDAADVFVLPYVDVFGDTDFEGASIGLVHPRTLDSLVRDTAIPSEDFEIVFAALRVGADVFVTDDRRLITCAHSLGLNFPLCGSSFVEGSEYENHTADWRTLNAK